jgi:hypothetical protein
MRRSELHRNTVPIFDQPEHPDYMPRPIDLEPGHLNAAAMNGGTPLKARPTLLPAKALLLCSQLMAEHDSARTDWTSTPIQGHLDAALRHILKYQAGTHVDPDSGHSHLVHAATRLLMAADLDA